MTKDKAEPAPKPKRKLKQLLFIGVGAFYITNSNWEPFIPENTGGFGDYGITGILRAAGVFSPPAAPLRKSPAADTAGERP